MPSSSRTTTTRIFVIPVERSRHSKVWIEETGSSTSGPCGVRARGLRSSGWLAPSGSDGCRARGQIRTLLAAGHARDVGLYPAAPCSLGDAPEKLERVMGFARLEPEAIREGVLELRGLLRDHGPKDSGAGSRRHRIEEVSRQRDTLLNIPEGGASATRASSARPLHNDVPQ